MSANSHAQVSALVEPPEPRSRLGRLVVVSYHAHAAFQPRGIRTRAVVEELERRWDVTLIAGPRQARTRTLRTRIADHTRYRTAQAFALDPYEPWALRRLRRWRPEGDLAVLVAYPFAPVAVAARRLVEAGVPYVVDVSDPWVLTARAPTGSKLVRLRAGHAERYLWEHAAGAIATTARQRSALEAWFPHLRTLVRPNGCFPPAPAARTGERRDAGARTLSLAHFGMLYGARIDIAPFLTRLAESGRWHRVVLHQFGKIVAGSLERLPSTVEIVSHDPRPWPEIVDAARDYDAALVVGNLDPGQLPSKVIDYGALAIPRLAVVADPADDAVADYVADKPGWLVLGAGEHDPAARVARHVDRWAGANELAPPEGELWISVAREIADFLDGFRPVAA